MPARHSRFRALNDDLRSLLDRREAWPKYSAMLSVLQKARKGGRRADIVELRRGVAVPEKYVRCLARMAQARPVLDEYLAMRKIPDPQRLSEDQLVDCIAGPLQHYPGQGDPPEEDWQLKGVRAFVEIFTDFVWKKLIQAQTLCRNEKDVHVATSMIMATVGRHLERGKSPLSDAKAIAIAEHHMKITHGDYLERAIDLWRTARWTYAFGVVNRQRIACGCVLPLKEDTYDAMRRGERDSHSCRGVDLASPSQTLFIEAFGHKPDAEYPFFKSKTIQTVRIINLQIAAMSLRDDSGPAPEKRPLRILSIAGNDLNEKRLKNHGFRPTGTKMPGFEIPYMEMDERQAWIIPIVIGKLRERLLEAGEPL